MRKVLQRMVSNSDTHHGHNPTWKEGATAAGSVAFMTLGQVVSALVRSAASGPLYSLQTVGGDVFSGILPTGVRNVRILSRRLTSPGEVRKTHFALFRYPL